MYIRLGKADTILTLECIYTCGWHWIFLWEAGTTVFSTVLVALGFIILLQRVGMKHSAVLSVSVASSVRLICYIIAQVISNSDGSLGT